MIEWKCGTGSALSFRVWNPRIDRFICFWKYNRIIPGRKESYSIRNHLDLPSRFHFYASVKDKYQQSVDPDDSCTVIFTSGSTGRPKGVMLSSYNILNAAAVSSEDQTLTAQDRTCLILPLFHIFGLVAGLFANAMAGSVLFIPKDIHITTLLALISSKQCTIFHSVPTMLIAMLNHRDFDPVKCASIRCTIISGAATTKAQIEMFQQKLPNDHFLSAYGLSEMSPVSTTLYEDTQEHVLHTVGKPARNISIVLKEGQTFDEQAMKEALGKKLAHYKIPSRYIVFDSFPTLGSGKIDAGALKKEAVSRLL